MLRSEQSRRDAHPATRGFDPEKIRGDFPIFSRKINGYPLRYLDNASTTQKPRVVIDALANYYGSMNANVHRGVYTIAEEATRAFEDVRGKLARLLGNVNPRGIVYTRNATEAINLVARAWVEPRISSGDEILLTEMEHHSNLVPWIMLAERCGATLRHLPVREDGHLEVDRLGEMLTSRTRFVAVTHASNVLGTINPIGEIADAAHAKGARILIDAAQSVPQMEIDLSSIDIDFIAFSAHKMLGPTGVGVLWGNPDLLDEAQPILGGGEMIREVRLDRATYNDVPWKFEAGTPNIADVVAFGAALDYIESIGLETIRAHEIDLTSYALERLRGIDRLRVYGPDDAEDRTGVISFYDGMIHPHDLATMFDQRGIAVRAGHHCAQPLMRRLGVPATARASFYLYNDRSDVDALIDAYQEARAYFG